MEEINKILTDEANECLLCKKPNCKKYCPIGTDIPEIIKMFKEGKIHEAGEVLFENNPMSAICAMVCPHEDQCAGHCIKGRKKNPVEFYRIEEYISREFLKTGEIKKIEEKKHKRVAVIGSGPAGFTIAAELIKRGYDVTVFEKNEQLGGILRYGIPEFRLPREIIDNLVGILRRAGVKFKINTTIGQIITLDKQTSMVTAVTSTNTMQPTITSRTMVSSVRTGSSILMPMRSDTSIRTSGLH